MPTRRRSRQASIARTGVDHRRRRAFEISGTGTDDVRVGNEGGRCRFTFCPACGATVFYVDEDHEHSIAIPVGAFAEPGFPAPTFSVHEDRMHRRVGLPADV